MRQIPRADYLLKKPPQGHSSARKESGGIKVFLIRLNIQYLINPVNNTTNINMIYQITASLYKLDKQFPYYSVIIMNPQTQPYIA